VIIDERTYTLHPGKLPDILKLYEAEGKPIQWKHLGDPVGWFFTDVGTLNQIVHLWRYENYADREKRRAAMGADPEWKAYLVKALPLIVKMENRILMPAPFSPIR
jgi:hypothetical protein